MIENIDAWYVGHTTQKRKLSVNYFFSKYEQIRIWFVQIYYRNSQIELCQTKAASKRTQLSGVKLKFTS